MKKLFLLAAITAVSSGCSVFEKKQIEKPTEYEEFWKVQSQKAYERSRQVAFMPYSTQGVDVQATHSWMYGNTHGVTAISTGSGMVFLFDEVKKEAQESSVKNAVLAQENNDVSAPEEREGMDAHIAENDQKNTVLEHSKEVDEPKKHEDLAPSENVAELNKNTFNAEAIGATLDLVVHFPTGSASRMYNSSNDAFYAWLEKLKAEKDQVLKIVIVGYTDDVGLDDLNIPLTLYRAQKTAARIRAEIPEMDITEIGSTPNTRIADNRVGNGRKTNRRAEIYVVRKTHE